MAPYLLWAGFLALGGFIAFKPLTDLYKSAADASVLLVLVGVYTFIAGILVGKMHAIECQIQNLLDGREDVQ